MTKSSRKAAKKNINQKVCSLAALCENVFISNPTDAVLILRFRIRDLQRRIKHVKETIAIGAWRSLVARLLWEQEVPSSNLGAPTMLGL